VDSAISHQTSATPWSAPAPPTWIETFAGVLLTPAPTFKMLAERAYAGGQAAGLGGAAITVLLVFALDALRLTPGKRMELALVNVPFGLFTGFIMWLLLAGTLALLAASFDVPKERIKAIFVTTGWSYAPWILMAPVFCYQRALGHAFVLLAVIPLIWTVVTQIFAIKATFQLKSWQTLTLVFVIPAVFQALSMMQLGQAFYVMFSSLAS
jgi:Yip1 domain